MEFILYNNFISSCILSREKLNRKKEFYPCKNHITCEIKCFLWIFLKVEKITVVILNFVRYIVPYFNSSIFDESL